MTARLLPALDQTKQPPTPSSGDEWGTHGGGITVLAKYSKALDISNDEVRPERLKSVPNPWARLLLFEQALYERSHPAHRAIRSEWRGMMAAIGLARHLGLQVGVVPVDLASADGVVESLRQMAPRDESKVWDRLALIKVGGQFIGGTSSRTLVFSGIRPIPHSPIPFRDGDRLTDPTSHYLAKGDRISLALLVEWLSDLRTVIGAGQSAFAEFLGVMPTGEGAKPIPRLELLLQQVEGWLQDTADAAKRLGSPPGSVVETSEPAGLEIAFPASHPGHAALARIRQVVPRDDIAQANDLLIAGSERVAFPGSGTLEKGGIPYTGDLTLPKGMSASIKNGKFVSAPSAGTLGATLPDLSTFFESKLLPVSDVSPRAHALECAGTRYLLPFNAQVLKHVSPDDLIGWTKMSGQAATGIRVRLEIPIGSGLTLVHERKYEGTDVFDVHDVDAPAAYIWPDFESPRWTRYFWFTREAVAGAMELVPVEAGKAPPLRNGARWGELNRPVRAWVGRHRSASGLLPIRPEKPVTFHGTAWDVSVDFGSTHTRVFRRELGAGGTPTIREVQLTPRARPILGTDGSLPYYFFVDQQTIRGSDAEAQSLVWLPLEMVPEDAGAHEEYRPIDGVIYWGTLESAPQGARGLRGNLKWHGNNDGEKHAFRSYLAQLFLMVAAEAAADGARIGSLITAYPSVLPLWLRHRHRMEWQRLERLFGVQLHPPVSESDALASFLVDQQGAAIAANLIAVDIGGSTSDVSLWIGGNRVHSDSVRLAGDLFSRVITRDTEMREAVSKALRLAPFRGGIQWDANDETKNGLLFNAKLRTLSQEFGPTAMPALSGNLNDGPGSAGERALSYLGYLFATLGYLLGLMARRAGARADHFEIRFAGKGSGYLDWLESLGSDAGRSIVSTFFLAGLGNPKDVDLDIHGPGTMAKQEVGRGLLAQGISPDSGNDDRVTFAGERGFFGVNGELDWAANLDMEALRALRKPESPTDLSKLEMLNGFVDAFEATTLSRKVARALGISRAALTPTLRNRIHERLFGPQGMWAASQAKGAAAEDALIEPIFIVEAKTLLATVSGHHDLFK